ncbi:MAG: MG2 domain-containing protein [Archangium sp.]|nr:MG2 domain-containing protein [Archangium sp.]
MRRLFVLAALAAALPALAQDFDAANRYLQERSYSRACEAFTAFLKAKPEDALAREASAKKAAACVRAGKGSYEELRKLGTAGEKDFPRAVAMHTLWERGEQGFDAMAPLLKQAMGETGRRGTEARSMLENALLREMDNNSWNVQRLEKLTELGLSLDSKEELNAAYRFRRARARLNNNQKVKEAEAELRDVGSGKTDVADDAIYALAERRENESKYVEALELFDEIVKRFSPTTSNMRSSAESHAANIRRPSLSVSVPNNELPGVRPQVYVSFRNVKNARWALKRADPLSIPAGTWPSDPSNFTGAPVKSWTSTLSAPSRYAPGSTHFDLDATEPGLYVIEVAADGETSHTWALISQHVVVAKTDRTQVVVAAFDVETGQAQPDADVALYLYRSSGTHQKLTGKTNASGIATFKTEHTNDSMVVWTKKGPHIAWSSAGGSYWQNYNREHLAYVMTDRPLYKPGETVGLKLFLRSREGGPSTPLSGTKAWVRVTDPNGKQMVREALTTNAFGTASFTLALDKKVTLGAYNVQVEGENQYFTQTSSPFRVEEYKPPEYIVSVEALGNPKPGDKVKFKVKAAYYSGGAVANATGRALVVVKGWQHQFGPWPDDPVQDAQNDGYGYGDEEDYSYRRGRGRYQPWYGQFAQHTLQFKTGADGTAEVEAPAYEGGGQNLEYAVQVFVTDSSRREIAGGGSIKLAVQPFFVDLKTDHFLYRPGERVTVRLRAEDANGRPADPDVVLRLMRLNQDGQTSKITETRTRLSKGLGRAVLDADAVGQVRIEVLDGSQASEAVIATTDLWLTSDTKPIVPGPGFQLFVDRAPLKVGDNLRVLVAGNKAGGHVLLTLESDVLAAVQMVELKGRARFVEFKLPADVSPNGWLHAFRFEDVQMHQQQLPFRVKGSEVELGVDVDFGRASAEPGSAVTAVVKTKGAAQGLALETALTVVDESLFAIAPERKDFLSFFGRTNRQQRVTTYNSYNQRYHRARPVVVAVKQQPSPEKSPDSPNTEDRERDSDKKALAAPPSSSPARGMAAAEMDDSGGMGRRSEEKSKKEAAEPVETPSGAERQRGEEPIKVRSDFSTSAGWYAQLASKSGAPLSQSLKLKDSLTSWKAVATVVSEGPNLGQGSTQIRTAKPLMVRLQAPRFFVEGDEVVLSAVVESHLAKAADIEVIISAPGFKELSPGRKTVRVEPEQVLRVDAKFKVVDLGERTIRATVRGGGTSDGMEWKLPAFVHGSAQRQFFAGRVKDTQSFEFELPEKRKASLTKIELSLSPTLLAVMFDALPYLAEYPYGCVEQTLSRFVPATIARRAVKDLSLPATRVPANLDDMVLKGLQRLYDFQHGDGGWGWWSSDTTNLWMTAYVVSSLSLAKSAGLDVKADVIARGREYLKGHLGEALNSPETHAYMVYALASTGGVPKPALDTAYSRRTGLTPRARAQLALALLHLNDPRARVAVENLDDVVKAAQSRPDAAVGEANDIWSTSAAIEATAFTLMAYARYDLKSPLIGPLTDFLVLRRNGGRWRNTRDTAFAVYALADLARREGAANKSGVFVVMVNGKEVKRVAYNKGGLELTSPVVLGDAAFKAGKNTIQVKHDGAGTGYYGAIADVFNMNDFIKGIGGDVKVKRTYTMLGKPSTDRPAPTSAEYGMPVESGVRVRVDLEITANKAVEFVMVEDLKAAGFEAVILQSGPAVCNYACAHAELRTDRVAMFLTQIPVGVTKVSYELRAEVPGRFAALPARVEAMYAPEITATADEMRFEVRDAPDGQVAR